MFKRIAHVIKLIPFLCLVVLAGSIWLITGTDRTPRIDRWGDKYLDWTNL